MRRFTKIALLSAAAMAAVLSAALGYVAVDVGRGARRGTRHE